RYPLRKRLLAHQGIPRCARQGTELTLIVEGSLLPWRERRIKGQLHRTLGGGCYDRTVPRINLEYVTICLQHLPKGRRLRVKSSPSVRSPIVRRIGYWPGALNVS